MKKLSIEEVQKRIDKASNYGFTIIGDYKRVKTPAHIRCNKCGKDYYTSPYNLYHGTKCSYCTHKRQLTTDEYKEHLKQKVGNEYTLLSEYVKSHDKVKFRHNKCGTIFYMAPHSFDQGQRCPHERHLRAAKSNGISLKVVEKRLEKNTNGEYKIYSGFTFASKPCLIIHNKCKRIFKNSPANIYSKYSGCPYCYSSKGEDAVREFLKQNNYQFKEQYKIKECKNIRSLPFDFAVFLNDKLLYLIEYQGIQHYKPKWGKKNLIECQKRDQIKLDYCNDNNINLIVIPYRRLPSYKKLKKYVFDYLRLYLIMPRPNQA